MSMPDTHTGIVDEHVDTSTAEVSWHETGSRVAELRAANAALAAKVLAVMRLHAARRIEQGGSLGSIEQGGHPLDARVPCTRQRRRGRRDSGRDQ